MRFIYHIVLGLILLLFSTGIRGQNIDSLKNSIDAAKSDEEKSDIYSILGNTYVFKNFDSAVYYLNRSIELIDSVNDPVRYADYYNSLGIIENSKGNLKLSFEHYMRSNQIYEKLNDERGVATTNHNIGAIYDIMKFRDKALNLYESSLEFYEQVDDKSGISGILNNIGEIYYGDGDYIKALEKYLSAYEVFEDQSDRSEVAIPLHNIGRTYQKLGEFNKAVNYLSEALEIDASIEDYEGMSYDYYELGEVYKAVKNYGLAEKNYNNSLEYAKDLQLKTVIADNLASLAELATHIGDYKKSLDYQETYEVYRDSVFDEKNTEALAELQLAFEIEQKEKEIQLLKLSTETNELKNKQNNLYIYISFGLTLLLGVMITILVSQNRLKNKAIGEQSNVNNKIYEQNNNLRHYNERLKYSQVQLSELNATKDKFFSIISHDLRSPLNSLSGMLQILMKNSDVFSIDELVAYGRKINESVSNLTILLENLLQWSNSQMGKVQFDPEDILVSTEISSILDLYRINIEEKEITVDTDFDPALKVYADKNMLDFIIRNIFSNALKFTQKMGRIRIFAEDHITKVNIGIEDNGIGIKEENLQKLFVIKHHYTTPGTANEKGTGLGLILSNEFVKRHGGNIKVKSKFEKGTTFTIEFPKKKPSD